MSGDRLEGGVSAVDHLSFGFSVALEGVFDETGDVVLVFDNQHAVLGHVVTPTLAAARFAVVSELLNLGYGRRDYDVILRMVPRTDMHMQGNRARHAKSGWPAVGVLALFVFLLAQPAHTQFLPFPASKGHIVEGNWQSCREDDGRYSERVYDHIVNGAGLFEVHLGPRREFALFKGVQDAHRAHASAENLLKPWNVEMENNRAKQRWEIPSLGLVFSVTLGGGSRTDCESWYVLLEQVEKTSQ